MTETIDEATSRATRILGENDYVALSTVDENGPWAAVVAYSTSPPCFLYFMSRRDSRHARAIEQDPRVAGVAYDSAVTPDDADSVQFSGTCEEVSEEDLARRFLEQTTHLTDKSPEEELAEFQGDDDMRLYQVTVAETYVLDQEKWIEQGLDARKEALTAKAFAMVADHYAIRTR